MNFQQSLRYLERIQSLGMKFGLDNVRTILSSWQDPQLCYPAVVVAGSNGKGSVCAMLTRILTLHGYRAGLYTSPHLVSYRERIRIGGRVISKADFSRGLTELRDTVESLLQAGKLNAPPTHFETLTCLALWYFHRKRVDLAVMEVGLGGRFDATNVVQPCVSVITTISFEHQRALGNTLKSIAFEKAGIIKTGVPVICGVESASPLRVIQTVAARKKAPLIQVFDRRRGNRLTMTEREDVFRYQGEQGTYTYKPSLAGIHQGRNAAVAIVACEELGRRWKQLEKSRIIRGVETTRWEGRLEVFAKGPLVLLDGAHNLEGARALRTYLRSLRQKPLVIVFATMSDKKFVQVADILFPLAERIYLTRFPYYRAASPDDIARRVPRYQARIRREPDVPLALRKAREYAGRQGVVLVTGSLFLVGEVKKHDAQKS